MFNVLIMSELRMPFRGKSINLAQFIISYAFTLIITLAIEDIENSALHCFGK